MLEKLWKARIIIISTSLACAILFGLLGFWLDHTYQTKPRYTIILVLLSFPVTQIIVLKALKQLFPKPQTPSSPSNTPS